MPALQNLIVCLLAPCLLCQCKVRKGYNADLASQEHRLYNPDLNTGVIQELVQGMQFAGDVHIALTNDGNTLATVGSIMSEQSRSSNDITRQDFGSNYETNRQGLGGLTAVYLWDAKNLRPIKNAVKSLYGYDLRGIRDIAFTTDGQGLAVCADNGLAFWPDITNLEESRHWTAEVLNGRCMKIAFGRVSNKNVYGSELASYEVLAIGTSSGIKRYRHSPNKPNIESICNSKRPVKALTFRGSKTHSGLSVPDGDQLLFATERTLTQGGPSTKPAATASYGLLSFAKMPSLNEAIPQKTTPVACSEHTSGSLGQHLPEPSTMVSSDNTVIIASQTERYMQLFRFDGRNLQNVSGPRGKFVASAERDGGVAVVDIRPPAGDFDKPLYFTGSADRTARIWQYDVDGTKRLDILAQINMGQGNYVTSGVFLKHHPIVVFGDRGGVYLWNLEKALKPQALKVASSMEKFTAIGLDDGNHHAYIGTASGSLTIVDYRDNSLATSPSNIFSTPVRGIEFTNDLKTAVVYSDQGAKLIFSGRDPEIADDIKIWDDANRAVGYKFGSDNSSLFSVNKTGEVRMINSTMGQKAMFQAKLNPNEQVEDFSVYPMKIQYQKIIETERSSDAMTRSQEIHPFIAPVVAPTLMQTANVHIYDAFNIFGENKRAKIAELTGQSLGVRPAPSAENSDIIAGSDQTPEQARDQERSDQQACIEGRCEVTQEANNSLRRMQDALKFAVTLENTNVSHVKIALLLNSGRILMVDLANEDQWEIEYRKSPVFGFSGFFQKIFAPNRKTGNNSVSYQLTNDETGYLARSIDFTDDGACMMISIRSGAHLRCIPILQSSAKNVPSIKVLTSRPARRYFDPWIVFNGNDRQLGTFAFAQFFTMAVAADSHGGMTSFNLNYYNMTPYSRRMHRLNFIRAATKGSRVKKFAASIAGDYAVAIHEDNVVRLHWIDRAFEIPLLDISGEELNVLRDFAQ